MHKRKRGKSSSKKPMQTKADEWLQIDALELENIIVEIAKTGATPSVIGMRLRDLYGVPGVKYVLNKKLSVIMRKKGIEPEYPEDLRSLMKKAVKVWNHLQHNPRDIHNRRNLQLIESKIRRLVKYYHRTGKLSRDWEYSIETAKLIVG